MITDTFQDEPLAMAPRSIQAEQAILCGILQEPAFIHQAANLLKPEHFYTEAHQLIFSAMMELYRSQIDPTSFVVAIPERLRDQGNLDSAGGAGYVLDLITNLPEGVIITLESFRYWSKILLDNAKRRELIIFGYELVELAQDKNETGYMQQAQTQLMTIQETFALEESTNTGSMLDQAIQNIENRISTPEGITGLSTGLPSLDRMTHGFQPGQLISIGARPGGGKTAFGMNISAHVALEEQKPVLYFSLEMDGHELMERTLHGMAGTNTFMSRIKEAREKLKAHEHLFLIEDKPDMTLTTIQAKIQKAKATQPNLGLIVIDHLGLIASEPDAHRRFQNRAYELGNMTRTFKMLAKSLRVPILLLCQLNREIENQHQQNKQNKKPQLSHLRDTGSIEMDSDIVLFTVIDRDENRQPTGKATLSVAKQRNGALGEISLCFIPHLTMFKEVIQVGIA